MSRFYFVLCLFFGSIQFAHAGSIDKARELFQEYVTRGTAFDPAAADLYSDSALIRNKRTYPTGQIKELEVPAPQYKSLIRTVMPLAKMKNDHNTYSDVSFAEEGDNVRIKAARYSVLKKYTSPLSLLVGPNKQGQWLILEELSESQP